MNKEAFYEIKVDDKSCRLRKPKRTEIAYAASKLGSDFGNYIEVGQILLNSCWVDGDEELRDNLSDDNASYNISACSQAIKMIEIRNGELKKL